MFATAKASNADLISQTIFERKILRQNIAFGVANIIVFAAVRDNSFQDITEKREKANVISCPAGGRKLPLISDVAWNIVSKQDA